MLRALPLHEIFFMKGRGKEGGLQLSLLFEFNAQFLLQSLMELTTVVNILL